MTTLVLQDLVAQGHAVDDRALHQLRHVHADPEVFTWPSGLNYLTSNTSDFL